MPSWVPEIETKPAPPPLLLVQSFVNTWEADANSDLLADGETARTWLHAAGLVNGRGALGEDDLVWARSVREGIRALLVHNGGGPAPTPHQLEPLHQLARQVQVMPTVAETGDVTLRAATKGSPLALGDLLVIIRDAQRDGTWPRLKACANDECLWAFYDRSHAVRGAWCDMAVCGNRIKNRNLRSRKQGAQPSR